MRWGVAAAGAALLVGSACVPPVPMSLSYDFVVSYIGPSPGEFAPASTLFGGTVTNTGVTAADYTVTLEGSNGPTGSATVLDVLVGQTAVWSVTLVGSDLTLSQAGVTSTQKVVSPVSAVASITGQRPGDFPPHIQLQGTLTNTGSSIGTFSIEIQSSSGAVSWASASAAPGQTVEWLTILFGTGTARIIRTTTLHPPP